MKKQDLLNEIMIFNGNTGDLDFNDGTISTFYLKTGIIITVKTSLKEVTGRVECYHYKNVLENFRHKTVQVEMNSMKAPKSFTIRNGYPSFELYLKDTNMGFDYNLYASPIEMLPCPADIITGIQKTVSSAAKHNHFSSYKQINAVNIQDNWVTTSDESISTRYRMCSKVPFKMEVDAESIKTILTKIIHSQPIGIAESEINSIPGYIFCFERMRIFVPKCNFDEINNNKLTNLWLKKPENEEEKDILEGARKSRDQLSAIITNYDNMVDKINSRFIYPCGQLYRLPKNLKKILSPVRKLKDEIITLIIANDQLTIDFDGDLAPFRESCPVKKLGSGNYTFSIKIIAHKLYQCLGSESIFGLSNVKVGGSIKKCLYIKKNQQIDYLITGVD